MNHTVIAAGLFVLNNGLAIHLALRLGGRTCAEQPLRRSVSVIANFSLVVVLVQQLIGTLGLLTPVWTALFLAAAALILQVTRPREASPPTDPGGDTVTAERFETSWLTRGSIALLAGAISVWFVPAVVLGTRHGFDDLVYHATIVAGWLTDQRISLHPLSFQAYFPLNAELLASWFMLPHRTDAFASLTALYWLVLAATAMLSIVYDATRSFERGCLAAALFACAAGVQAVDAPQGVLRSFAAVDLAGPAALLAAVALISRPGERRGAIGWGELLQTGLLAGLAMGSKVSFAPPALILLGWLFVQRWRSNSLSSAVRGTLIFGTGVLLTGAYWYVRNLLVTGNPLYPAEFGPFDGPFGRAEQGRTTLIHWIRQTPADAELWRFLLRAWLGWPWFLGILSLAGYTLGFLRLIRTRAAGLRGRSLFVARLLLLIGVVLFLTHPLMPFSGTVNRPNASLRVDLRFLILPFATGLTLLFVSGGRSPRADRFLAAIGAIGTAAAVSRDAVGPFSLGAAVALPATYLWPWIRRVTSRPHSAAIVAVGLLALLTIWYPIKLERSTRALYELSPRQGVFEELEKLPAGTRLSMLSHLPPEHTFYFKLFGRRLQLRPLALEKDGSAYDPMGARWEGWWRTWEENSRPLDSRQFYANLRQSGARYVIVTRPWQQKWAAQFQYLMDLPAAHPVYVDDASALWRLDWDD